MKIVSLEACNTDLEAIKQKISRIQEDIAYLRRLMLRYFYADALHLLNNIQLELRYALAEKETIEDYIRLHYPAAEVNDES